MKIILLVDASDEDATGFTPFLILPSLRDQANDVFIARRWDVIFVVMELFV
jgi:hypothetical protein